MEPHIGQMMSILPLHAPLLLDYDIFPAVIAVLAGETHVDLLFFVLVPAQPRRASLPRPGFDLGLFLFLFDQPIFLNVLGIVRQLLFLVMLFVITVFVDFIFVIFFMVVAAHNPTLFNIVFFGTPPARCPVSYKHLQNNNFLL